MINLAEKPSIKIAGYGWRPQLPDLNDLAYTPTDADLAAAHAVLTEHTVVDLRASGHMPDPYNQEQLGSCTANSAAGDMEYTANRLGLKIGGTPSRLFIYYNERVMMGTVNEDSGATIRASMKAMHKFGAPPENEWPYDISKFTQRPPVADFTDALKDVVLSYQGVRRAESYIVASLLAKRPVQIGFTVYESFEQDIGNNGLMPWPQTGEQVMGGHAVLVVGIVWINRKGYWIVRNSWGTGWADGGYFYMPLRYLMNTSLASDYWNIQVQGAEAA